MRFEPSTLRAVLEQLRAAVRELHPGGLTPDEARELVNAYAEVERLAAAGKAIAARVVERSGTWRTEGHRTAAHWMADATGMPVGQAVGVLQTARRLEHLPRTMEAFKSGDLAETKVKEVAAAATVDRSAEKELLDVARTESVASLREKCQRVRAEASIARTRRMNGSAEAGTSGTGPALRAPFIWMLG